MAKELHLNCLDKPITKVVHVVQNDTGRKLNIYIDDKTITHVMAFTFIAEKPSGLKIYNNATYVSGHVEVVLTNQTLAEVGNVKAQLQITDTSGLVTSYMFYIAVDEVYRDDTSIESSNEFTALQSMTNDFANIKGQFEQAIAAVTVDSEVITARTGADGTQYNTLSARLNAENTAINADLSQLSESINDIEKIEIKTLFNSSYRHYNNKLINCYSGLEQDSSIMAASEYIEVTPKSVIYMTFPRVTNPVVSGCAWYSADKNYISGVLYDEIGSGYYEKQLSVPSNAKYLRFGFPMSIWGSVKVTTTTNIYNYFKKTKEIKPSFIKGTMDKTGSQMLDSITVVSDWIQADGYNMVIATFPDSLKFIINISNIDGDRNNYSHRHSLLERTNNNRFRLAFRYADDTSVQSNYQTLLNDVKIYLVHTNAEDYDISIAPSDADFNDKQKADIVLDGQNDTDIIQAIFGSRESIKTLLYCGTYNVTKVHSTLHDKNCAFSTNESDLGYSRKIELFGQKGSQISGKYSVTFKVAKELHESINEETSVFLVPRAEDSEVTISSYNTLVRVENVNILGYGYDKPIIYMDFLQAKSAEISRCLIRSDGILQGLHTFTTIPNNKLTGIRVGFGSNNGVHNHVEQCYVFYCYNGYSCCGEHYIFKDCLAHHCYIGFVFGDKATRNQFEHPNIMFGCSIEGCYRFMLITKNGIMEEMPFVEDRNNNLWHSTLHVIGLSTESWWGGTDDGASIADATKGILEVLKGCYTGNIEISSENIDVVESGSCTNMSYTHYKDGTTRRKESSNLIIVN